MKLFIKLGAATVIALGITTAVPASAQSLQVGILNGPPIGGEPPGGFCYDLMEEMAAQTGLEFAYQPTSFADIVSALTAGTVDVMCSLHSPSNIWRSMGISFTSSILTNPGALVVQASNVNGYTGLEDLRGEPVAIFATAAIYVQLAEAAGADVRLFTNLAELYESVATGDVRAAFVSEPAFRYANEILGAWPDLKIDDAFINPPEIPQHAALGVRSDDVELLGRLQSALERMKLDGTLANILSAWALAPPIF